MVTPLSVDALTATRHPSAPQGFGIPTRALTRLAYTALFFGCIYPFSITGGLSANYLFLILPLVLALLQGRARNPGDMLMVAIVYYVAVLVVAALYQYDFATEREKQDVDALLFLRRLVVALELQEPLLQPFRSELGLKRAFALAIGGAQDLVRQVIVIAGFLDRWSAGWKSSYVCQE